MDPGQIRMDRNILIANTDWLRMRHMDELESCPSTTLTPEQYTELLAYRKALRDFPKTAEAKAEEPAWPTPPEWMK